MSKAHTQKVRAAKIRPSQLTAVIFEIIIGGKVLCQKKSPNIGLHLTSYSIIKDDEYLISKADV